jgi:hypothetical protein
VTSADDLLSWALAAGGDWAALEDLAGAAPPGLVTAVRGRWSAEPAHRDELQFLLSQSLDPEVATLLPSLLPGAEGVLAARLLDLYVRWTVPVPRAELVRLLADPQARPAAVKAAGHGPAELAPLIRPFLDDPSVRGAAAMTLAQLGDVASLGAVTALLETGDRAIPVALELLGDASVVPAVRARLDRATPAEVEGLHRLLIALTGHDPVIPRGGDRGAAIRAAWRRWDPATRPRPRVSLAGADDPSRGTFVVTDGQGLVRVAIDGSGWSRSLRVGGRRAYDLGSICDTCATTLRLAGWPARPAEASAQRLRAALADVPAVTPDLLDAAAPLLCVLRSGEYVGALLDLDLPQVAPGSAPWPGTDHFRLRADLPFAGVVLPTQPLDAADDATIVGHTRAIAEGRRPAALLIGWVEDRYDHAQRHTRHLVGLVLDGHHKLLAYAAAGVPARVLMVFRVEDSWGPPDNRTQWINDVTQPLLARRGAR